MDNQAQQSYLDGSLQGHNILMQNMIIRSAQTHLYLSDITKNATVPNPMEIKPVKKDL